MIRQPPKLTRPDTLCPYTAIFRSLDRHVADGKLIRRNNGGQIEGGFVDRLIPARNDMAGVRSLELSEKRPLLFSLRLIIKSKEPGSLCVNLTRIVDVETIVTGWKMLRECERDSLRIGIDAGRRIHDFRSEERRVGKECVSTFRSWWSQYH